jgi:hypothetical protein
VTSGAVRAGAAGSAGSRAGAARGTRRTPAPTIAAARPSPSRAAAARSAAGAGSAKGAGAAAGAAVAPGAGGASGAGATARRPAPRGAPRPHRAGFVGSVVLLLGGCLVTLLLLNTLSAQDAFRIDALQTRVARLTDVEQALEVRVQSSAAPQALAAAARGLGMVPSGVPAIYPIGHGVALAAFTAEPVAPPAPVTPPAHTAGKHAGKAAGKAAGKHRTGAATARKHATTGGHTAGGHAGGHGRTQHVPGSRKHPAGHASKH